MAFLSLGLNIDEPRIIEQTPSVCPEQESSDNILCDQSPALESAPFLQDGDSDLEFSERTPAIEELRKKILEGITPAFRFAPRNGQLQNEFPSSAPSQSTSGSAAKSDDLATPLTPEILWSIMDGLTKKSGEDAIDPLVLPTPNNANGSGISAFTTRSDSSATTATPELLSPSVEDIRKKPAQGNHSADPLKETDAEAGAATSARRDSSAPAFATFKFGYLPGRGLLYSIIGHEVAMFGLFLLVTYGLPSFRAQKLIVGSQSAESHLIYLPEVGGGTEGQKSPGGGRSKPQQASAAPARASKGFAYPGAQAILSDPPNPTNAFQTLLRPLMVHPEPLKKLVPLPNIVQMAETRLPTSLLAPKPAMPQFQPVPQPIRVKRDTNLHRDAKWDVPVSEAPQLVARAEMPKLPAAQQLLPETPKIQPKKQEQEKREAEKLTPAALKVTAEKQSEKSEKQAAPPSTAQVAKLEMHGKAAEPLLSLSPMPLPAGSKAKVPAGEARGKFAVAPGGTLNPNATTPGKADGTRSISPATGQENAQSANAATESAANTGTGSGHNPATGGGSGNANQASGGGSTGAGNGSGNTSGGGVGGAGNGNGRGASGTGAGKSGHGAGTGSGGGSGAGSGAFPGITIQGEEGSSSANNSSTLTVAPQTPYQITIVATASSGGGLQDFGVFENERVYTVYIPMQRTPQEEDPTWTLQYALAAGSTGSSDAQLIAPSPVMREWPQIPGDLEKKYSQRQVVVYALLGADGKISHVSVKQTPDVHVSEPIAQALSKWVFRPAQLNNQPVAVKILIGIPI